MFSSRLLLAAMVLFSLSDLQAGRIGYFAYAHKTAEEVVQDVTAILNERRIRHPRVKRVIIIPPDESEIETERKAIKTVRELEDLQDAMDDAIYPIYPGRLLSSGSGDDEMERLTDLISGYSLGGFGRRLETKEHEIKRIISKTSGLNSYPSMDNNLPGYQLRTVREKKSARPKQNLHGDGTKKHEKQGKSRQKRYKNYVKIIGEEDDDEDDDDDDDDEEIIVDDDDADVEVIKYIDEERPKIFPRVKYLPYPIFKKRKHKPKQVNLQLPPELIEAMHEAQMAKMKPKETIQIIEVARKEPPATPAPALPPPPPPPPPPPE